MPVDNVRAQIQRTFFQKSQNENDVQGTLHLRLRSSARKCPGTRDPF